MTTSVTASRYNPPRFNTMEGIVQEAERQGRILGVRLPPQDDGDDEPWTAPPSRHRKASPIAGEPPETLELVLGNQIYISESRVLQDAGDAVVHLRQAARHRLR